MNYEKAVAYMESLHARETAHLNGDLLAHLEGTAALLADWESSSDLRIAAVCHAVYGTDGFPQSLLELSERKAVREVIGTNAEQIVYFYASCDRGHLYRQLGTEQRPDFRDRYTDRIHTPDASVLSEFMELTFANELELVRASKAFRQKYGNQLGELFGECRQHVSAKAYNCYLETLG